MAMSGVPEDMIWQTRNGITPEKFQPIDFTKKNPYKFVYPSSPDRGLERVIYILDRVRQKYPEVELHVFYGFENLYKYGGAMVQKADMIKKLISERPWIKYHGNTEQKKMMEEFRTASMWLHPADFIETFCITALETVLSGIYPVTRKLGALEDTLREAEEKGMATLLDMDCVTTEQYDAWTKATMDALESKAWERIDVTPEKYSWENVAKEWIEMMKL